MSSVGVGILEWVFYIGTGINFRRGVKREGTFISSYGMVLEGKRELLCVGVC